MTDAIIDTVKGASDGAIGLANEAFGMFDGWFESILEEKEESKEDNKDEDSPDIFDKIFGFLDSFDDD